jgi:hypothetical protein
MPILLLIQIAIVFSALAPIARLIYKRRFQAAILVSVALLAVFASLVLLLHHLLMPNLNLDEAVSKARQSIQDAGGADEVRKEADGMFEKFGLGQQTNFYSQSQLAAFPAIQSLGRVGFIMPDPPFIVIRAGNHLDGYTIEIYARNHFLTTYDHSKVVELSDGIYVYR